MTAQKQGRRRETQVGVRDVCGVGIQGERGRAGPAAEWRGGRVQGAAAVAGARPGETSVCRGWRGADVANAWPQCMASAARRSSTASARRLAATVHRVTAETKERERKMTGGAEGK